MNCELCHTDGNGDETRCRKCGFDTSLPSDVKRFVASLTGFRPGDLLDGRYRIDRILGFGGMSVVYKAHDEVLDEDVAIKVINSERVADDAKLYTDIRRDIVSTRKLAHPDIVKVHDLHKTGTCGFLTMEYVRGTDLASLIAERGRLDEDEACRIALQIAEALAYAHANGVVHCDIKPGNLLLSDTGRLKVTDFGISRVMQEKNTGLTGLVVGTPAYMSPEQVRGERPTPLADMYALGIVMWHCLMGAPPFTRGDIGYQHVHVPLPPLEGVSAELERIVRRAAAKLIADRFPSMDAMAEELRAFMRKRSGDTIMLTPPPRPANTIMLTPPPRPAAAIMLTPPSRQAATVVLNSPPPEDERVQTAPPPAGKPLIAPAQRADTPAEPAGEQDAVDRTADAAPPAGGLPVGAGTPPPAKPKAKAAVATAVVFLAAAALWALFPTSGEPPRNSTQTGPPAPAAEPARPVPAVGPAPPPRPAPATRPAPAPQRARPARAAQAIPAEATPAAIPAQPCTKAACFSFSRAELTPAVAQPGQTVRCTASYTFRHNEGGAALLEVEEAVQPGIRSGRGANRRVKAGPGPNQFDVSFTVPDRAGAGTYPVTLTVRRRLIRESVTLELVVSR